MSPTAGGRTGPRKGWGEEGGRREAVGVGFDEAAEAVVFVVVVAVLDVVPPEDFDFAEVGRLFPLREGGEGE